MQQHSARLEIKSPVTRLLQKSGNVVPIQATGAAFSEFAKRVAPYLEKYGVSRIGSVTGLDVIGVPVWFACRPNSFSLAVSQGKGLTDAQAFRSAVMECLEYAVAERPEHSNAFRCSVEVLAAAGHVALGGRRFATCMASKLQPDATYNWVKGYSLFTGNEAHFPFEMVCMDLRQNAELDTHNFRISSVGLAGHVNLLDAVLHGLLEVIENDATALSEAFVSGRELHRPVTFTTARNTDLLGTLRRVRDSGFEVHFFVLSEPGDIPVVRASIFAGTYDGLCRYLACTNGYACRFDIEEAALAALLEAIQTRATEISGARDDIEAEGYARKAERSVLQESSVEDFTPYAYGADIPHNTAEKLTAIKNWLRKQNCPDAYYVPLNAKDDGLNFVKVLVPGMDVMLEGGSNRMSKRMLERMTRFSPQ
jgi:ribosomal protein S12 methylthiotransferase accessory factor